MKPYKNLYKTLSPDEATKMQKRQNWIFGYVRKFESTKIGGGICMILLIPAMILVGLLMAVVIPLGMLMGHYPMPINREDEI